MGLHVRAIFPCRSFKYISSVKNKTKELTPSVRNPLFPYLHPRYEILSVSILTPLVHKSFVSILTLYTLGTKSFVSILTTLGTKILCFHTYTLVQNPLFSYNCKRHHVKITSSEQKQESIFRSLLGRDLNSVFPFI